MKEAMDWHYVCLINLHAAFQMESLSFKKMDFSEFCAAAISVHQLEGTDRWEYHARSAYEIFEKDGNRVISIEELARV
jgi:Ca2+-binding EF-hand superfamily protein